MSNKFITENESVVNMVKQDRALRRAIMKRSPTWFFHYYFRDGLEWDTAPFQHEMLALIQDISCRGIYVMGARGSGKSVILNTSLALWSIFGIHQARYILLVSRTQAQAQEHLRDIRDMLENNIDLKKDLGPFVEEDTIWRNDTIVIKRYNAKVRAVSMEQPVRGTKHLFQRPDIIIIDDVENTESSKTSEGRDKTFNWITKELLPTGHPATRVVFLGNMVHRDCALQRFRKLIEENKIDGIFKFYPMIDDSNVVLWKGKYPTRKDVEQQRRNAITEQAWQQEYLLNPIGDDDRVINPEDIKYYTSLPDVLRNQSRYIAIGVDLAISEKDSADYTAIVAAQVVGDGKDAKIYVLPGVVNKRMGFKDTAATIKTIVEHHGSKYPVKVFIEDVGYQRAQVEELKSLGIDAEGCSPGGLDKRARLALLAPAIANGEILFSYKSDSILTSQIIDFGVEKHEDVMDAFVTLARGVRSAVNKGPSIIMTNLTGKEFRMAFAGGRNSPDWGDVEDAEWTRKNSRGSWNRLL